MSVEFRSIINEMSENQEEPNNLNMMRSPEIEAPKEVEIFMRDDEETE